MVVVSQLSFRYATTPRLKPILLVLTLLSCLLILYLFVFLSKPEMDLVIIVDAGSSGSRCEVFSSQRKPSANVKAPPNEMLFSEIQPVPALSNRVTPGVSSLEPTVEVFVEYFKRLLAPLVEKTTNRRGGLSSVPIKIYATAGMRLLPSNQQTLILSVIMRSLLTLGFASASAEVISGSDEGLYGWLAVNYLAGTLTDKTVGMCDLGGGSTQITFEATDSRDQDSRSKDIKKVIFQDIRGNSMQRLVYSKTFLGLGMNEAIKLYSRHLLKESAFPKDPCLFANEKRISKLHPDVTFTGTGDFEMCFDQTREAMADFLKEALGSSASDSSWKPHIDEEMRFIGLSEFWYTTNEIFGLHGQYSRDTFLRRVQKYCESSLNHERTIQTGRDGFELPEERFLVHSFKSCWLSHLLHDVFNFPEGSKNFYPMDKIGDQPISWTMGVAVFNFFKFRTQEDV